MVFFCEEVLILSGLNDHERSNLIGLKEPTARKDSPAWTAMLASQVSLVPTVSTPSTARFDNFIQTIFGLEKRH